MHCNTNAVGGNASCPDSRRGPAAHARAAGGVLQPQSDDHTCTAQRAGQLSQVAEGLSMSGSQCFRQGHTTSCQTSRGRKPSSKLSNLFGLLLCKASWKQREGRGSERGRGRRRRGCLSCSSTNVCVLKCNAMPCNAMHCNASWQQSGGEMGRERGLV